MVDLCDCQLTVCSLDWNLIGDVGAHDFAECLKTNTTLTSLEYEVIVFTLSVLDDFMAVRKWCERVFYICQSPCGSFVSLDVYV